MFLGPLVRDGAKANQLRLRESSDHQRHKREKTLAELEVICYCNTQETVSSQFQIKKRVEITMEILLFVTTYSRNLFEIVTVKHGPD